MKRARFILVLFLLMSLVFAGLAQQPDPAIEAKKAYNNGLEMLRKGNYDAALQKFEEAVKLDPNLALAYYGMGIIYKRKKNFVEAEKAYKMAIEKDPNYVKAYTALGLLQSQMDKLTDALNSYQAALKIKPDEVKALWGMGYIYMKQKQYPKAIEYLKKAVEVNPKYYKAWENLGVIYLNTKKYTQAVEAFQNALKNAKRTSKGKIYLRLGDAYLALGKLKDAESAYKSAVRLSRSSTIKAAANFGLGEVYKKRGQKQLAIQYYQKASRDRNWKQAALYEIDMIKNADKYVN